MINFNPGIPIIGLYINSLNSPIIKQILSDWIQNLKLPKQNKTNKQNSATLKVKGWRKI